MKKLLEYRTGLIYLILLLITGLTVSSYYGLLPLPSWLAKSIPHKSFAVTTAMVSTINKPLELLRSASVESPKSAPVHAEFSGRISDVYVKEGEVVKVDQPLVKIAYSSLTGRNSTKAATITPVPSLENLAQAQAQYDKALQQYNRLQNLYTQGAIPKRQLDSAEIALQTAMAAIDSAQSTAVPTSTAVTSPVSSGSAIITAPNPGTVTGLAVSAGAMIEAGQSMMTLGVGEVQLVVHIEQKDLYLVHPGTLAITEVANQIIPGQVATIYPEAGANNIPTFRAHINIPKNIDGLLKPGMAVNVRIQTDKSITLHTLPTTALFQDEQGLSYIYLLENGKALRQQVTIGETQANATAITSYLPEHSVIITSNVNQIKDGDTVIAAQ